MDIQVFFAHPFEDETVVCDGRCFILCPMTDVVLTYNGDAYARIEQHGTHGVSAIRLGPKAAEALELAKTRGYDPETSTHVNIITMIAATLFPKEHDDLQVKLKEMFRPKPKS